jgi:malate/lactate dehydrogenase
MSLVAIIGAGEIGGAAARALALRSRVALVRLIDQQQSVAAGKALDLRQSGPMCRSDTRIEGAGDLGAAAGAAAIILADAAGGPIEGENELSILRRLSQGGHLDASVLVCASPSHAPLMQRAFDELGLPRRRVMGSAPEALAATGRMLAAVEAHAAANQVALTVIGRPERFLIPWADSSIAGHSAESMLSPPQLRRIERRMLGLWPPGPGALGTAAALFSEAANGGASRRIFSAFVSLDRDNGTRAPVCAWPVSIGTAGLDRVTRPSLSARDQIVMDEVLQ